jgi:hypothetical protein
MKDQNYANHHRYVPMYHFVLSGLIIATIIGSLVNLFSSLGNHDRIYSASLIVVLSLVALLLFWYSRQFALRAQDRAIRAEENFRHYILTGKPLDSRLTLRQIVGLRFASDEEFPELARRAVAETMPEDNIKRAVKHWRADHHRA